MTNIITSLTTAFIILLIAFLPALVAYSRKTKNKIPVLIINLFLGWTIIGWVIALAMAYSHEVESKKVN